MARYRGPRQFNDLEPYLDLEESDPTWRQWAPKDNYILYHMKPRRTETGEEFDPMEIYRLSWKLDEATLQVSHISGGYDEMSFQTLIDRIKIYRLNRVY